MSYNSLTFRGMPVIVLEPIKADQFDGLEAFSKLVDDQGLQYVIVSQEAWDKYESFITKPLPKESK